MVPQASFLTDAYHELVPRRMKTQHKMKLVLLVIWGQRLVWLSLNKTWALFLQKEQFL